MLIGLTVGHFDGTRPSRLLLIAQKMGVEFVEFNRSLLEDIEAVSRQIGSTASGYHLPLVEEDGFDFSCHSHAQQIDEVVQMLNQYGQRLNLRYALTHPPQPELAEQEIESSLEYWVKNLQRLNFPILLENVVNWGEKDFDRLITLLQNELEDKFWGICFDGPHSFLRGEDVFSRYRQLSGQVKCLHLSDCSETEDLHLPFGRGGVFPVKEFLKIVKMTHNDCIINLEINPGSLSNLKALVDSYLLVMKSMRPWRYYLLRLSLPWKAAAIKKTLKQIMS
ncbi:MAG: hypothetical protein D6814_18105 [Calditrichaeota bacterium]|nr:MAG: hypothetical protein D6814_18105 [Calditrichota bacterium]